MLQKIRAQDAQVGMYVESFDGRWTSHPFWRAHFVIASPDDLARVRSGGVGLYIDTAKGIAPASACPPPAPSPLAASRWRPTPGLQRLPLAQPRGAEPLRRIVAPAAFGKADRARATALAQRSTTVIKALFKECRVDHTIATEQILSVVRDISETLEQNSMAFASVTRLKSRDDGTYIHSVAVCALMISLAHEIGLPLAEVRNLGTAGLLHDIGKLMIDEAILRKEGPLSPEERVEIERHPALGHAMLVADPALPPEALDVCLHHHERLDGSGYPFGLSGDAISRAVRIASICDVYDAMTSQRPYKKGMLPAEAIGWMDGQTGRFDSALLFRFMRIVGVFPAGKLLRLRSNRLGVVLPATRADCLPVVRAFYETVGNQLIPYVDTVLSSALSDDQAVGAEDPGIWFSADWKVMRCRIMAGKDLAGRDLAGPFS